MPLPVRWRLVALLCSCPPHRPLVQLLGLGTNGKRLWRPAALACHRSCIFFGPALSNDRIPWQQGPRSREVADVRPATERQPASPLRRPPIPYEHQAGMRHAPPAVLGLAHDAGEGHRAAACPAQAPRYGALLDHVFDHTGRLPVTTAPRRAIVGQVPVRQTSPCWTGTFSPGSATRCASPRCRAPRSCARRRTLRSRTRRTRRRSLLAQHRHRR